MTATRPSSPGATPRATTGDRSLALGKARWFNRLTIGWNVAEAGVALAAGIAAGSVSLVGFGLDSCIEVSASLILAWRLHQESAGGCMAENDKRAQRAIAVSFALLAGYVLVAAGRDLLDGARPEVSPVGIAVAALSLLLMPLLARAKRRLAPALGSRAVESEADQTSLCALLSAVLLVGLGLNALLGWWWADPVAGLVIGGLAAAAAVRAWRADALADTCCG